MPEHPLLTRRLEEHDGWIQDRFDAVDTTVEATSAHEHDPGIRDRRPCGPRAPVAVATQVLDGEAITLDQDPLGERSPADRLQSGCLRVPDHLDHRCPGRCSARQSSYPAV